ncbi:Ms4527A family Cys-rich leader peptide [Mycobacterium simulans]
MTAAKPSLRPGLRPGLVTRRHIDLKRVCSCSCLP